MRMSLALYSACLLLSVACRYSHCQGVEPRPWQSLSDPSAAEIAAAWTVPPPEYGPEPYYGMNGPITVADVQRDLDTMKCLGFRAVTVQYGYGSDRAYLSKEYFDFFERFIQEAKKRDLRVWIVDDAGYPSGFAGGKFTTEHPELRMQALMATALVTVSGGQVFEREVGPGTVAITATELKSRTVQQIPVIANRARWTAPPGTWSVTVIEHVFRTSPTRSDTNVNRVKDASQSLEDYLDPAATAQYLALTHEGYKKAVGEEFGKTILGFRGDEPDFSINGLPWTPKFFASFEQKKHYDIRPHLASLLQSRETPLTPEQLLVKADYYDVFADLFRDGFFAPQARWCAANGLEYQVHLNHEEMQIALAHSEGDFFRDMRYVQVPGIDSIWHQIWTDTVSDFPRLAASAAHVYGHPRAFTESFAAYRPAPDVTMARYILNEQFVRGINLVETMYFPASTGNKGGPGPLMRDPQYPKLMQYTSRLSYLMSQGRPTAEVALLLPSQDLWMGNKAADDTFVSAERLLSEHQVEFDIVDEDAIGSILSSEHGAFISGSGNRYRAVIVPNATLLPGSVVRRLQRFAAGGGKVTFLGAAPARIAEGTNAASRLSSRAEFAWATILPGALPVVPTPPAQPPSESPAGMKVAPAFWSALQQQLPAGALRLERAEPALKVIRRKLRDASTFLLFNESATPLESVATLRCQGSRVEVWDPETGAVSTMSSRRVEGGLQIRLELPSYGTQVLVVR